MEELSVEEVELSLIILVDNLENSSSSVLTALSLSLLSLSSSLFFLPFFLGEQVHSFIYQHCYRSLWLYRAGSPCLWLHDPIESD